MALTLVYPKALTDPEWKKLEKEAKVSATGVGQTLRTLESAVKAINTELNGKRDPAKLATLYKTANTAVTASRTLVFKVEADAKNKKNDKAVKLLDGFSSKVHSYFLALGRLEANDHRGIDWTVKIANDIGPK